VQKQIGSGLALKIRPSKRSHRPVVRSVTAILWCGPLEATHEGSVIRSSASTTPGTGCSSRANTASTSA
jgi:hypothetical protein